MREPKGQAGRSWRGGEYADHRLLPESGAWSSASLGECMRPAAARSHCLISRGFHCKAHTGRELGARSLDQGITPWPVLSHNLFNWSPQNFHPFQWEESPWWRWTQSQRLGLSPSPYPSLLHGQPPLPSLPFPPSPNFFQATFPVIS